MKIFKAIAKYFFSVTQQLRRKGRSPQKIFALASVSILLVISILAIAAPQWSSSQAQSPAEQKYFSLRILHTNDHHAHLEPVKIGDRTLGGIARRRTLINL